MDSPEAHITKRSETRHAAQELAFGTKVPGKIKLAIVLALVAIAFFSWTQGRYPVSPGEFFYTIGLCFTDLDSAKELVAYDALIKIRLPRILCVMLVGAALSVAGASYQGMFKNPLVSPDLLGASAGAGLGASFAMLMSYSDQIVQLFAFGGAIAAVGIAVWLNRFVRYDPLLGLVLGGILVGSLFQSGTSIIKLVADANDKLPAITYWLMGSFHDVQMKDFWVVLVPMGLGFALLMLERWKLNVLSFGEEEARSLGINTRRTRLVVILAATLITASSVAIAGVIGWVGLVIPHLGRAIVGPNYRVLLPTTMAIGAGFLLLVDDIARMAMSVEIPIGILTAILGVPFFIFIFRRNTRGW